MVLCRSVFGQGGNPGFHSPGLCTAVVRSPTSTPDLCVVAYDLDTLYPNLGLCKVRFFKNTEMYGIFSPGIIPEVLLIGHRVRSDGEIVQIQQCMIPTFPVHLRRSTGTAPLEISSSASLQVSSSLTFLRSIRCFTRNSVLVRMERPPFTANMQTTFTFIFQCETNRRDTDLSSHRPSNIFQYTPP